MIQISTASAFQNDDERISTASAFLNDDERTSVIDGLKKLEIKGLNILNYGKVLKATFLLFSTVYFTMMNHNHPANAPHQVALYIVLSPSAYTHQCHL